MKALTAYTNLHSDAETLPDLRRRGKAVRFHPDPVAARRDSRDGDLIVELTLRLPDDATFLIYRETGHGAVIFGQGSEFADAYRAAAGRDEDGNVIAAALTGRGERRLAPLSDYIAAVDFYVDDPATVR